MNAGVEIILERIKTNPEEFVTKGGGRISNGKWSRVLDNYSQHLDKEDYDAIKTAIDKVQQDYFTEEVMTILVDGRDIADDEEKKLSQMAHNVTLGAGATRVQPMGAGNTNAVWSTTATGTVTLPTGSITLGNTTLEESRLKQLLQLQQEYANVFKKPKRWWNKTIPELLGKK
jgi:hypothetical protein